MAAPGSTPTALHREIAVGGCGAIGERPMPRRLYRFHCLGGEDVVFDLTGRWLSSERDVRRHADRVALGLMSGAGWQDWTAWSVDVRDAAGRAVLRRAFSEVQAC